MFSASPESSLSGKTNIPGFFLPHLETFVADHGGDIEAPYCSAGLNRLAFLSQQETVSEDQFNAFVSEAVVQSRTPAFGLEMGQRFTVASFGLLGRALMSCQDLRSAMVLLERYSTIALPLVRCVYREEKKHLVLEFTMLSQYPALNQIILEAMFSSGRGVFSLLTGVEVEVERMTFTYGEPLYKDKYTHRMANSFEFVSQRNQIYIPRKFAEIPFINANLTDAKFTLEACEAELIKSHQTLRLSEKVIDLLRFYLDTNPSSKDLASRLNLTERTMRRRLADEGVTTRELLQAVREEAALYYLGQTDLQITQIALKLGYQEISNFRSAFKKWRGVSPREWRQKNT